MRIAKNEEKSILWQDAIDREDKAAIVKIWEELYKNENQWEITFQG